MRVHGEGRHADPGDLRHGSLVSRDRWLAGKLESWDAAPDRPTQLFGVARISGFHNSGSPSGDSALPLASPFRRAQPRQKTVTLVTNVNSIVDPSATDC